MIATISKDFGWSASHVLYGLPAEHPCGRMHGHNYTARVEITGVVDTTGFVVDYGELRPFGEWIDRELDHRHLNDVLPAGCNPTAEHIAYELAGVLVTVVPALVVMRNSGARWRVGVSETAKTWAWHDPWLPPAPPHPSTARPVYRARPASSS